MKVSDVMQQHVDFVTPDASVREVARVIFGRGINGVPVCEGKKVVGFITDRDILARFFPSMQEYMEDPVHESDFEDMEEMASKVLNLTAEQIMIKNPVSVTSDTPLLRAQSLMKVKDVGRLPVINKGYLVGILSKGDIFKAIVGNKMSYVESEEYHDWIAKHYDLAIGWESRLPLEISALKDLFKKHRVTNILDIGCGTGEHAIELAKHGFSVVGMENSILMFKIAEAKWKKLPKILQKKVTFIQGDYVSNLKKMQGPFEAVVFMGNAFAHIPHALKDVLKELNRVLLPKNALLVVQVINFEKALKDDNRVVMFHIKQSKLSPQWEHSYLWFYSTPRNKEDILVLNAAVFDFNGKVWTARSMNSVKTARLGKKELQNILKKIGFRKTSFYGTKNWGTLFKNAFKPLEHDWLTVVAKR